MTHRQILELAGVLAEHGVDVLQDCRGIPLASLRRFQKATESHFQAWIEVLEGNREFAEFPWLDALSEWCDRIQPTLQEISTSGVLIRVACTLLHSVGERQDIPLAVDVARQTIQSYSRAVQVAIASVTLRPNVPPQELCILNRLGAHCDRLSDLLCGSLLPLVKCSDFAVDAARAADYAETFGRRPGLVRLPVRQAFKRMPKSELAQSELAEEVQRALVECLPYVKRIRTRPKDELGDLAEMMQPQILRLPERPKRKPASTTSELLLPVSFPTCSFAAFHRKDSAQS